MKRRQFLAAGLLPLLWPRALPASAAPLLQRTVGGQAVPVIGLGTWRTFDHPPQHDAWRRSAETLQRFVELGGTLVDSSPMYGRSSENVGAMASQLGLGDRLYYSSKVWTRGRAAGREQLERECRRFERPRIDLMHVHNLSDVGTQLGMLREAREEGLVRHIGVSHYRSADHAEVERVLRAEPLDVLQINLSMIEPEAERRLLPLAAERGMAVLVNRVFAEGALFARVRGRLLPGFAAELGIDSWAQFFLKWVLGRPEVSVALTGTGNPAHIADNFGAARGELPDAPMRQRMREAFLAL